MAHKKGMGSSRNGRDSKPKMRGVKRYGGELVRPGTIIVRQCGTKIKPGVNVGLGRDYTIYALIDGHVTFEPYSKTQRKVSVYPAPVAASEPPVASEGATGGATSVNKDVQPKYFDPANITCSTCGTVWPIGSTRQAIRLDICSHCHPFYTAEQRIVDTAGQVDRFMKRLAVTQERQSVSNARKQAKEQPAKKPSLLQEIYGDEA